GLLQWYRFVTNGTLASLAQVLGVSHRRRRQYQAVRVLEWRDRLHGASKQLNVVGTEGGRSIFLGRASMAGRGSAVGCSERGCLFTGGFRRLRGFVAQALKVGQPVSLPTATPGFIRRHSPASAGHRVRPCSQCLHW